MNFDETSLSLPESVSRQIARVLRLKNGETIVLLDGLGLESKAVLTNISETHCQVIIEPKERVTTEPTVHLSMVLALTQREKFEWMLQKCTEIGVTSFRPFVSSRTLVQKPEEAEEKRERWEKIVQEAAEQSHRGKIPDLMPATRFKEVVTNIYSENALKLILWEEELNVSLKPLLQKYRGRNAIVLIGPEGGLSAEEVALAREAGFQPVSLGKRILRMETAAITAAALVLYELD